jgi:predicted phage terminase large subunit-like protein
MGSLAFAQEYEAQFVSASAGIFQADWFDVVDSFPADAKSAVRAWDKASTPGGGDYSAGVLMVLQDGTYYVADVIRGQWSSHQRNQIIGQTAATDAVRFGTSMPIWIEQEPGSGGRESAEFTIRQLAGYNVRAERPTGDKATRAQPFAAQCEAGNAKLIRSQWNREYLGELVAFPAGRFDDQVDASSMAFSKLSRKPKSLPWGGPSLLKPARFGSRMTVPGMRGTLRW